MSTDTNTPAGSPEGSSIATTAAATTQAVNIATPEPEKRAPAKIEIPSDEFKRRLDEERAKTAAATKAELLKSLGGLTEDEIKAVVADKKRLEDEKRSDLEKRDRRIGELEPRAKRADELEATLRILADEAESALNEKQREAVKRIAGDDPARRIEAIKVFREAMPPAPIATEAQKPQAQAPIPQAANTAAPAAPSPANPTQTVVDHLAIWEALNARHDYVRANQYYLNHTAAIVAAQRARG